MYRTPVKVDYRSKHNLIQCLEDSGEEATNSTETMKAHELNVSGTKNECIHVENVLSQIECSNIIASTEQSELFKPALLSVGLGREVYVPEARDSDRCIIDDVDFAQSLFERLKEFIPTTLVNSGFTWEAVGLNERLRVLRYSEGHVFPWHQDGNYMRNSRERSYYTLMLYLNEGGGVDFTGGSTLFKNKLYDLSVHENKEDDRPETIVEYTPKTGNAVIFLHNVPHEGEKLRQGTKYAIRTDVMYRMKE